MSDKPDIRAGRLSDEKLASNFADMHPPLTKSEAIIDADRCYFCYDAPCMNACPTSIDIPLFIRQISTGNPLGSAKTIFDQNILGGMCARVCPTETLCEEVCVREVAEGKPVQIGRLQRYATDVAMAEQKQFYARAESTGKSVAVPGVVFYRITDGKIAEFRGQFDRMSLMQQLGVIPRPNALTP